MWLLHLVTGQQRHSLHIFYTYCHTQKWDTWSHRATSQCFITETERLSRWQPYYHQRCLTHWTLGEWNEIFKLGNFQCNFSDWWLRYFFWKCSQMNVPGSYWWQVNIIHRYWLGAVRQQAITWPRSMSPYGVTRPQWVYTSSNNKAVAWTSLCFSEFQTFYNPAQLKTCASWKWWFTIYVPLTRLNK